MTEKTAAGSLGSNENETVRGKAQVYNDPEGYHPPSPKGGDVGYSTAAVEAAKETREEMAERLFGKALGSAAVDQQLVDGLFSDEAKKDRQQPHSLMQRRGRTKTASVEHETLSDKVRRVTGLR